MRYKADVAQGFSQRPLIDYDEIYSHVVDATTFKISQKSGYIREKIRLAANLCSDCIFIWSTG